MQPTSIGPSADPALKAKRAADAAADRAQAGRIDLSRVEIERERDGLQYRVPNASRRIKDLG